MILRELRVNGSELLIYDHPLLHLHTPDNVLTAADDALKLNKENVRKNKIAFRCPSYSPLVIENYYLVHPMKLLR